MADQLKQCTRPTTNAQLADLAVDHRIDLLRFERGVVYRMIAVLNASA